MATTSEQRIADLENALQSLIDLYVKNQNTEHEFIGCITPKTPREMSFRERRACKVWRAFDDARELLEK